MTIQLGSDQEQIPFTAGGGNGVMVVNPSPNYMAQEVGGTASGLVDHKHSGQLSGCIGQTACEVMTSRGLVLNVVVMVVICKEQMKLTFWRCNRLQKVMDQVAGAGGAAMPLLQMALVAPGIIVVTFRNTNRNRII